jgi:hypothetical protein
MIKVIPIPKTNYPDKVKYGNIWWVNPNNYGKGVWLINFYHQYDRYVRHIYNVNISNNNKKPILLFKLFNKLFIYY